MTKNAIFKSTILSQPTTRIQTRTHTHTHTHGIRGASICVKSLVDRDIYTNRVLLDPKTCATILSQRDLFFYVKKKKKIVYLLGCANSWKLWMYLPRKDSTCYRIAIISIDFYFIYFSFALYPIPGDKVLRRRIYQTIVLTKLPATR